MATTLLDAARAYLNHGYQPVPVPPGQKGPILIGWQRLRLTVDELPAHFNGRGNIGLLLGAPSAGLVDVDLDCPEALELAPQYLRQRRPGPGGRVSPSRLGGIWRTTSRPSSIEIRSVGR